MEVATVSASLRRTGAPRRRREDLEVVPTAEQFDLVIIGGGPGGYAAALYGASAGLSIAMIDKDKVGGTCLHRGCIPAKSFLETAAVVRHVNHAKDFGIDAGGGSVDFAVAQNRKQKIVEGMWKGLSGLIKSRKIASFEGVGSLGPERTVTVTTADGGRTELQGRGVILAAGSAPRTIPGFDVGGPIMTSDEVLMLDRGPAAWWWSAVARSGASSRRPSPTSARR